MAELDELTKSTDDKIGDLLEEVKERMGQFVIYPAEGQELAAEEEPRGEVPDYARQRIEQLFEQVRKDRSRAVELKAELDRWGLFLEYEDRFLDMFRREQEGN